eukprot:jgi/Ulvmu1/5445/UM223_0006.1
MPFTVTAAILLLVISGAAAEAGPPHASRPARQPSSRSNRPPRNAPMPLEAPRAGDPFAAPNPPQSEPSQSAPGRNGMTPAPVVDMPSLVEAPPDAARPLLEVPMAADPPIPSVQPAPPPPSPVGAPGEGDLRLVGRLDINGFATGALQVFHAGAFGAVCNNFFSLADAAVACRQLGFDDGTTLPLALGGDSFDARSILRRQLVQEVQAPFVLDVLGCTGAEERLVDCPAATDTLSYESYNFGDDDNPRFVSVSITGLPCDADPRSEAYAFVACGMVSGPDGVTSEDGSAQFGRLEVFGAGGWGTACDFPMHDFLRVQAASPKGQPAEFSQASARVACRQLGFTSGVLASRPDIASSLSVMGRRVPILLQGADCAGSETTLLDCPGLRLNVEGIFCRSEDIIAVQCFSGLNPDMDGSIRLMDGRTEPGFEYGRLEIFLRGFWSTICSSASAEFASVSCRILGYDGGASLTFSEPFAGRFFRDNDNQVLAAELPMGLARVECQGNETALLQCSAGRSRNACAIRNSNATEATVLACANAEPGCPDMPPPVEGSVRMRGGFGSPCDPIHTGLVEVFHLDEWGAVCDLSEARHGLAPDIICRQLGFPHGSAIDPIAVGPDERFWLRQLSCRGLEQEVLECFLGDGFITNSAGCSRQRGGLAVACRMFPVVEALEAVTTRGADEGNVRQVGAETRGNWVSGRLELFFEGSWGQVCALDFNAEDADVACRQLGFGAGAVGPAQALTFGNDNRLVPTLDPSRRLVFPEVTLTLSGCNGSEATLLECDPEPVTEIPGFSEDDPGSTVCFNRDEAGLILSCVAEPEEGELCINLLCLTPDQTHTGVRCFCGPFPEAPATLHVAWPTRERNAVLASRVLCYAAALSAS